MIPPSGPDSCPMARSTLLMADGTAFAIGGVDAKARSPYLINPESLFRVPMTSFAAFGRRNGGLILWKGRFGGSQQLSLYDL